MSAADGRIGLSRAAKDLFARWGELQTVWCDAQSQEFQKTYLDPLEHDVRSALAALDHLNLVLQNLEHDCE
jgi:hypothetical protein